MIWLRGKILELSCTFHSLASMRESMLLVVEWRAKVVSCSGEEPKLLMLMLGSVFLLVKVVMLSGESVAI